MKLSSEEAENLLRSCLGGASVNQRSSLMPIDAHPTPLPVRMASHLVRRGWKKRRLTGSGSGAPTLLQEGNRVFDLLCIVGIYIKVCFDKDTTVKKRKEKKRKRLIRPRSSGPVGRGSLEEP